MVGLSQEQIARLLSGVTTQKRAEVAGIPVNNRDARAVAAHIDAHSSSRITADKRVAEFQASSNLAAGKIAVPGVPTTLAESGLTAEGFVFDDSQIAALKKLIHGKHVALIGAAGSGKTTMVKHALASIIYGSESNEGIGVRRLTGDQGLSIAIAAFTGIATQVLRDTLPVWLHDACKTIHQMLEYKPTDTEGKMFEPTRNAGNKMDYDIIILDESSMIGLDLWHNIIAAARPNTRFILIGDLNQLKPVADATMFAYALAAGIEKRDGWDIAELTTIHRQKEPAANKIIDAAHAILVGKNPVFDNPRTDPNWRVIGFELPPQAQAAHTQILGAIRTLWQMPTPGNESRPLFDPYADLLLTAGNGFDENDTASFVQQAPLNGSLSRIIEPPTDEHPVYIVDAGRELKRFAVGYRVMATKNESPDRKDRVTNGLLGRIVDIKPNEKWKGNRSVYGTEKEVLEYRRKQAEAAMQRVSSEVAGMEGTPLFDVANMDTSRFTAKETEVERQASHIITVKYRSGVERTYTSAADVASIQLAYAITVHKAQGSQADTVVIVCHQAAKRQLNREWLYTAVTRARRRVIFLYTRMGMAKAINTQQIFGSSLKEKIQRYANTMETGRQFVRLTASTRQLEVEHQAPIDEEYDIESIEE